MPTDAEWELAEARFVERKAAGDGYEPHNGSFTRRRSAVAAEFWEGVATRLQHENDQLTFAVSSAVRTARAWRLATVGLIGSWVLAFFLLTLAL